jgi:hypothetical protein
MSFAVGCAIAAAADVYAFDHIEEYGANGTFITLVAFICLFAIASALLHALGQLLARRSRISSIRDAIACGFATAVVLCAAAALASYQAASHGIRADLVFWCVAGVLPAASAATGRNSGAAN